MHPIFSPKRVEKYFKIYQQIYETSTITLHEITNQISISRNTVAKYLKIMYNHKIIRGPWLSLNPADNYSQYVYLLNFDNPFQTILTLKELEHVVYAAAFFGKWNIMVITDKEIDFTPVPGYNNTYFSGEKGFVLTPKVSYMTWDVSFTKIDEKINQFIPDQKVEHYIRSNPAINRCIR